MPSDSPARATRLLEISTWHPRRRRVPTRNIHVAPAAGPRPRALGLSNSWIRKRKLRAARVPGLGRRARNHDDGVGRPQDVAASGDALARLGGGDRAVAERRAARVDREVVRADALLEGVVGEGGGAEVYGGAVPASWLVFSRNYSARGRGGAALPTEYLRGTRGGAATRVLGLSSLWPRRHSSEARRRPIRLIFAALECWRRPLSTRSW